MTMAAIRSGFLCSLAGLALAGCGAAGIADNIGLKPGERMLFDGNYYPAKLKEDRDDRRSFTVTVRDAEQGLDGARAAGRHEGVRYCVETFGSSDIRWKNGGPDAPETALVRSDGDLVFSGRCEEW